MPYTTLFGRGLRLGQGQPKPMEAAPVKDEAAGQRAVTSGSGFMAGFRRKNLPRTLQVIGAGMRDIGGGNHLDAFTANEAEQQRLAAVEMAQGREQKQQDEQQAQLERAISTLPPEQQAWARINPEAFMRAFAEAQNDPNHGWQVGQGYSRAFRIRPDGTREDGAELPLRPRAPIMGYVMPGDAQDWDYHD